LKYPKGLEPHLEWFIGLLGWAHAQLKGANGGLEQQPPPLPLAKAPRRGCEASQLWLTT